MVIKQVFVNHFIISVYFIASAVGAFGADELFSENTGAIYIQQASEIHNEDPLDEMRTRQAIAFLESSYFLDPMSGTVSEQTLNVVTANCFNPQEDQEKLLSLLGDYLKNHSNQQMAIDTVGCLLEQLNTRVDREELLKQLLRKYSAYFPTFASDISTQLGFLAMEKSDIPEAMNRFSAAFNLNNYNHAALSQYLGLSKTQNLESKPILELSLYRIQLAVNPYNLNAALSYADLLQQMQIYDVAARAYEYVAELFFLLHSDLPVSREIIHSWMLSCYHDKHSLIKVLDIADRHRDPQQFDLLLESVAGKTLLKLGQNEKAKRVLRTALDKSESLISEGGLSVVYPEYLAWFHSFVLDDSDEALAWGNQAFVEDPNRPGVKAIFAYTLANNKQYELAKQYAEVLQDTDQVAALTMALVFLSEDQKTKSVEVLKETVGMSPETLVAEKAVQLLDELESEYIPSVQPGTIIDQLEKGYPRLVPELINPSARYTAKLMFNGSDFLYGADFPARIVIKNTSSEPLVISEEGLITGNLRVDAELGGDLNVHIPNLYSTIYHPEGAVQPGEYLSIPLSLNNGKLRRILLTYPQTDVSIVFTVHMESGRSGSQGKLGQSIVFPIQAQIRRRKVIMTDSFLMQRLDVLRKGQVGQKYQASALFTGLLAEKNAILNGEVDFPHYSIETVLLKDAVRAILADNDWKIRVHAMSSLSTLSIPLDHQMLLDISENLNHEAWPVRLSALYLLANNPSDSFQKVLDWSAEHDSSAYVRQMAVALGGKEQTAEIQDTTSDLHE